MLHVPAGCEGKEVRGCPLPDGHAGDHIAVMVKCIGLGSTEYRAYYAWNYVEVCDCEGITPDQIANGECDCETYYEMKDSEALAALEAGGWPPEKPGS